MSEEKKTSRPHQLKEGTLLKGRYRIESVVGEGGFGITYFGRDETLELDVAIKEYFPGGIATRHTETSTEVSSSSPDDEAQYQKGRSDFLKEARTLAKFQSVPGIVSVKDFFEDNNTAYIVMERLIGIDLRTWLSQKGIMTFREAFTLLSPVMTSLAKVHETGLIHRDISPANILVQQDGTVKLLDFGAARAINKTGDLTLSVVLKPGYSPEEQYRTKGIQGPWTDVYSLCATIYRMITGMQPDDSLQRLLLDEIKTPTQLGIDLDPGIEYVLMKGLAVRAEDRFQSMTALRNAFIACDPTLGTPSVVLPSGGKDSVRRPDSVSGSHSKSGSGSVSGTPSVSGSRPDSVSESAIPDTVPSYSVPGPGPETEPKKKGKGLIIGIIAGVAAAVVALVLILNPFGGSDSDTADNTPATTTPSTEIPPIPTETQTQPQSIETESDTEPETTTDPIIEAAGLSLFYGNHVYVSGFDQFTSGMKVRSLATNQGRYTVSELPYDFFCFQAEDGTNIIALDFIDEVKDHYVTLGVPYVSSRSTLEIDPLANSQKYYDELLEKQEEYGLNLDPDNFSFLEMTEILEFPITRYYGNFKLSSNQYPSGLTYGSPYTTLKGAEGAYGTGSDEYSLAYNGVEITGIWASDTTTTGSECTIYFIDDGYTEDAEADYVADNIQVLGISWTKYVQKYNGKMAEFEKDCNTGSFTYYNTAPFGFLLVPWSTNDVYYFQKPLA